MDQLCPVHYGQIDGRLLSALANFETHFSRAGVTNGANEGLSRRDILVLPRGDRIKA